MSRFHTFQPKSFQYALNLGSYRRSYFLFKRVMGSESLNTNDNCFHKDKSDVIDGIHCEKTEEKQTNGVHRQCRNGGRPMNVFANHPSDLTTVCFESTEERSKMGTDACDFNTSPNGSSHDPQNPKRRQGDNNLEDLITFYVEDQDDDDDDSDWEPHSEAIVGEKWFCINCTMPNFDGVHCDVCGEFKESEVVSRGFFASPLTREGFSADAEAIIEQCQEHYAHQSPLSVQTLIGFDERMLLHSEVEQKSHPHPERPDRLRAIAASLQAAGIFPGICSAIPAREITREELGLIHSLEHVNTVEATGYMLSSYFTPDTYANEHSARAARLAAGLCCDLASSIMKGQARNGFALVRPPGHHAGVKQAMGFCLHNNAAMAALGAQAAGADRVLIVDWDVHHGNGTQEIFEGNKAVLYISLHRYDDGRFYPGTGAANEVGSFGAEGYSVNIPWKHGGIGDGDYVFAFQHIVLPIALQFAPDLTIVSAGFDAARGDPLGGCDVTPVGFAQMAHMLNGLSNGKLLVILEGGYNLRSIASSATAVIKVLLGETPRFEMACIVPHRSVLQTLLEVLNVQLSFWSSLSSSYDKVLSLLESSHARGRRKLMKKKKRVSRLFWWKWGRKRLFYALLSARSRRQSHKSVK